MKFPRIQNRVAANASWIIGCRSVQAMFNLVVSMLTARFLGPANFGIVNYAESVTAFAVPIMQLGFTGVLVRELVNEENNEGEILGTSLISCIVSALVCMLCVGVFSGVINHGEKQTVIVCVLYSISLLTQAMEMLMYWFEAHLYSRYTSMVSLFAYFLVAAYRICLLAAHKSIYWFAVSNALDCFLISVGQFAIYRKHKGQKLKFSGSRFRKLFESGKYCILSGMMITIFSQTDRIMIKLMIGNESTGFYSAAVRCAGMTSFVFTAIVNSAVPVIFASHKVSRESFENNVKRLYSIVIYGTLLQSVCFTIFAEPVIHLLYGDAYMDAVPSLRILTWYLTFSYLGTVRNRWLLAEEKLHLIWRIDLSGAVANVILNLILIPHFGIHGAAFASLMTQFFTNYVLGWIMKELRPNNRLMMSSLNPRVLLQTIRSLQND